MSGSLRASSNSIMRSLGKGSCCGDSGDYDKEIYLDSEKMKKLGDGWQNNATKVSLYLIFRGITNLCGASHWAWILESNGLGEEDFFCSIEYGQQGIIIRTFNEYDGIENACRGCMGDSDIVFYKTFTTNHVYGSILSEVDNIKQYWRATDHECCNYNGLVHNCRNFAIELGKFLINEILQLTDSYNWDKSIKVSIKRSISLKENEIKDMFGSS
jgi:hypothetical protein